MAFDFPNAPAIGAVYSPGAGLPSYKWDGVGWNAVVPAPPQATTADTPPSGPIDGQFWWKSSTGQFFIWYDDGNSQQWVQVFTQPPNPGGLVNMAVTIFTASGTYTKPANLKFLQVEVLSGGGAGGGALATGAGVYSVGSGGGGGAWGHLTFAGASVPASVAYTVGAGGTSVSGGNGGTGGTTTFSTLSATGGAGGAAGNPSAFVSTGVSAGGVVSGGEHISRGASGGFGYGLPGASMIFGGKGADSPFGYGGGTQAGGTAAGGVAGGFGSGGGGATALASTAAQSGGAGGPGFIKITEYT
jgi:hypothetical protein